MSKTTATLLLMLISISSFSQTQTFHDFKAWTITGSNLRFSDFYGKKVMVVNTATECVWTYQYEALQDLYDQYKDSNFTIVGFPCNDFSGQEPGSDSAILDFCSDIYGVTFQMMSKVATVSHDTAEVYKWLQRGDLNGVRDANVTWNFNKYLIDEAGHWVRHFTNFTEPLDTAITNWIKSPSVLPDTTATGINEISGIGMSVVNDQMGGISVSFNNTGNQNTVISLVSMSGQLLSKAHDGMLNDGDVIPINTSHLDNGMYFLLVKNDRESKTFRLPLAK